MSVRALGLLSVALVGCLPVHTSVRNSDKVLRQFEAETDRSTPEVHVTVASSPERLELTAQSVVTCTREQKKLVKRWKETEKTTNTGLHAIVYTLGAIAGLGGGAVAYDANAAETQDDRRIPLGSDPTQGRNIGIGAAAAGGLLLVVGVASSIAARDDRAFVGEIEEPIAGTRTTAECDRKPAANTEIALLMPAPSANQPAPVVPLGRTDAQGRLVVAWADVKTPNGVRAEGEIVVGAVDALRGDVAIGKAPKGHGRVAGPAADPEVAWNAAVAANTPEAYDEFRAKHPTSPRASEANDRARASRAKTALVKLDEALAAGKLDVAGEQMTILRANGDAQTIESAQARLDVQRKATRLAVARQKMPEWLGSVEKAPDPAPIVAEIKSGIDAIREVDAAEAAKLQLQFDDARKRAVRRLMREGEGTYRKGDFAGGAKMFDIATTIAVDVAPVAKARSAAFAAGTRGQVRQARSLSREGRHDDALAILDGLLKIAPDDAKLAAEKAAIVAAKDRAEAAAAAKADREAARAAAVEAERARVEAAKQKLADDRARAEAEKLARAEAAKQKAEERKAAEEAAKQQRLADAEARKAAEEAAKQQRLADAEARKRAAEEKRLADEAARAQRRAEAAAKKEMAEQERLARDAERARLRAEAEAKRAEEARMKAEEARMRAEAARTGRSPLPPPVPAVMPPVGAPSKPAPTQPAVSGIPPAKPLPDVPVSTRPAPPAASDIAEARTHFEQGIALYRNGDYSTALLEFEASYRLNPQPFVLKNVGLAQKALFRYPEAIATLEKYLASGYKFTAPDPGETQKLVTDMKALLADVAIAVTPDGAQISVDGRQVGLSPLPRVVQLATGTHSIEATADGYKPAKRDIMVSAGVPLSVELSLEQIPTKGKLRITSPVRRATVTIDGKPVGETPLEIELEGGGHRVEVSAPKHKTNASEVLVTAGETREIGVPLDRDVEPKKKWYMNKYVWAGAGAAALGIIVLGVTMSGGTEAPIDGTLGTGSSGVP